MKRQFLHITLCIFAIIAISSCDKDDNNFNGDYLLNFVTYEGNIDGVEHFSFQAVDDSPIIKLSTTKSYNIDWARGRRTLIDYDIIAEKSNTEKTIEINQVINVLFDSLRVTTLENIKAGPQAPIRLKSIWRTGNFLNIDCTVPYTLTARQFQLVVDNATLHSEMVEAYLIQNLMGAESYFWRKAYGSFFIGNAWNLSTCKTMRIHLIDEAYPATYYDFKKK